MKPLSSNNRQVVALQVESFLRQNPNFGKLSRAQQAEVREATTKVVERMAEDAPAGDKGDPYAVALEDAPAGKVVGNASKLMTGQGSKLGDAIGVGVTQAARMVKEIDFPKFVGELINGTFHAIVTSSIEQMKAYAEMVKSVSMSLNEFKEQSTTDNQARDHLVQKYPRMLQIQILDGQPRVTPREDFEGELPDFRKDFPELEDAVSSLDEEVIEEKLVPAARYDIARGRHQLLATTILMGINRIVVTDGKINAKIRFQFSANEKRTMRAQAFDYVNMGRTYQSQGNYESQYEGGSYERDKDGAVSRSDPNYYSKGEWQYSSAPDVKVSSSVELNSDAAIQASGQILGEVSVNFKSETFPLEKMVNTDQLTQLQSAQLGAGRGALPAQAPAQAAPAAATPAARA